MAIVIYDSFTDSNGTSLDAHSTDIGALTWTEGTGNWSINSNAASSADNATSPGHCLAYVDTGQASGTINVEIDSGSPDDVNCGILFNFQDNSNYWYFVLYHDTLPKDEFGLFKRISGSITEVDKVTSAGITPGDTYNLKVIIDGDNVKCYVNSDLQIDYTAASRPLKSNTKHGMYIYKLSSDSRKDDGSVFDWFSFSSTSQDRYTTIYVGDDPDTGQPIYAEDCCAPLLGRFVTWYVGYDSSTSQDIYSRFNTDTLDNIKHGGIYKGIDPSTSQPIYAVAVCSDCPYPPTGGITTACCVNDLAETLYATFTDTGGACSCCDGLVVTLYWNVGTSKWEGTATFCTGRDVTVKFYCTPGFSVADFDIDVDWSDSCRTPIAGSISPGGGSACSPLSVSFTFLMPGTCGCSGFGNVTITVTE